MMHYSNWLIGVKNRACLRNACKTPPNSDCNNRGNTVDVQSNNPIPGKKISELVVTVQLWKKGKKGNWGDRKDNIGLNIGGPRRIILLDCPPNPLAIHCTASFNAKAAAWLAEPRRSRFLPGSERRAKACSVTKATVSGRAC